MEILNQIQANLLDHNVPLSDILRKAKVLASQLDSDELDNWVSQELDGYQNPKELPDYRVLRTAVAGTYTNGYYTVNNRAVPLYSITDDDLKKHLTIFWVLQGIRTVEEFSKMSDDQKFHVPADTTAYVNTFVSEDGYAYLQIHYSVGSHNFEQILDTVRNRLLNFILKLGKQWNPIKDPPSEDVISKLVSVNIYNNPQGGTMAVFDQRGQHVEYQYNAAGDININRIDSLDQFSKEITKLREEINRAKQLGAIAEDTAVEVQYNLLEISKEAVSKKPDKTTLRDHVDKIKELLKDVSALAGLVSTLVKLTEVATKLFN